MRDENRLLPGYTERRALLLSSRENLAAITLVIARTSICLAIIAVTVAVIAWLSTLYHMIQMACRRQPGAPSRGFIMTNPFNIMTNPFNIVFFPGDLTPRGRQHRKRFLISAIVFGAALGGNAVLIGVGRLLQN